MSINLSGITYRSLLDGPENPLTPGSKSVPNGSVNLSTIKYRSFQEFVEGGPVSGPGSYSAFIDGAGDEIAYKNVTSVSTLYTYVEVYITAAAGAAMSAPGFNYKGDVIGIARGSSTSDTWQGIYPYKDFSTLYWWDYWSTFGAAVLITFDTWHTIECAIRINSPSQAAANFKIDGVESSQGWKTFSYSGANWDTVIVGSNFNNDSNNEWYLDNAKISTVDWVSNNPSLVFSDGFETGNFSNWSGTSGGITIVTPP